MHGWFFSVSRSVRWGQRAVSPLLLLFLDHVGHKALVRIARSSKRRLDDLLRALVWYFQLDQTVEVVEHVWVTEHRSTPVGINTPLQLGVGFGDLALEVLDVDGVYRRMARILHVDAVVGQGGEVGGVLGFARRGEAFELVQDVLSRVRDDPVPVHSER